MGTKDGKKLNRPLLGVSELSHYWGHGKFWNQSGENAEEYSYPKPYDSM